MGRKALGCGRSFKGHVYMYICTYFMPMKIRFVGFELPLFPPMHSGTI